MRCNPEWLKWPGLWLDVILSDLMRSNVIRMIWYGSELMWSNMIQSDLVWSNMIQSDLVWSNMYLFSKPLLFIFFFSYSCVHNNAEKWRSGKPSITWVDKRWTQAGRQVDVRWTQGGCKVDASWTQPGRKVDERRKDASNVDAVVRFFLCTKWVLYFDHANIRRPASGGASKRIT